MRVGVGDAAEPYNQPATFSSLPRRPTSAPSSSARGQTSKWLQPGVPKKMEGVESDYWVEGLLSPTFKYSRFEEPLATPNGAKGDDAPAPSRRLSAVDEGFNHEQAKKTWKAQGGVTGGPY